MLMQLDKHRVWFIVLVLLFRCLLEVSYVSVVSPFFSYSGFLLNFSYFNYFLSWVIFLSGFLGLSDRLNNLSDIFYITGFMLVMAPLSVLYGYDSDRELYPVIVSSAAIAFVIFITSIKSISFRKLPTVKGGLTYAVVISAMFVIFLINWYYISGVSFNLDLKKVYDFRIDNQDLAGGALFSYTNNWTFKIFNMFLLSVALLYSRFFLALLIMVVQVYFFAASAHKGVLFTPFIIVGAWFYFKKSNSLVFVPAALSLLVLLTLVTFYLVDDIALSSFFSRRLFFVPANLTYAYFDFFSQNPNIIWSNSVLSSFLEYPYDSSMAKVIGGFLGSPDMGANNGFVASGYAHAGIFGVFFYSLIIGMILRFLNHTTSNFLPLWFSISLSLTPIRTLIVSSDLFVVMLTHGFLVALILIFFARSKRYEAFEK